MDISQLLLSGARMTAQHCDKCGYPLFEKNGRIICANCTEEEEEKTKKSKNIILEEKRSELLTRLKETKDLNEIEHILKCLNLLKELI
jgi:UPF0148 protein